MRLFSRVSRHLRSGQTSRCRSTQAMARAAVEALEQRRLLTAITSYHYDYGDPAADSTAAWNPSSTHEAGWLGGFGNGEVTLTVNDWAPHVGLDLTSDLAPWHSFATQGTSVTVYLDDGDADPGNDPAVYRYFNDGPPDYVDEQPLGDYAALGYIPHSGQQVKLRFVGSGFSGSNHWDVLYFDIQAVQPALNELTVTSDWSGLSVTDNGSGLPTLLFAPGTEETASVHLSGLTTPDVPSAYDGVLYDIRDGDQQTVATGVLGANGADVTLPVKSYIAYAGVDRNGNDVLDLSERARTVLLDPVYLESAEIDDECPCPEEFVLGQEYVTTGFNVDLYALNLSGQREYAEDVASQTYTIDAGADGTINQVHDSLNRTWTINGSTATLTVNGPGPVTFEVDVEASYTTAGVKEITLDSTAQVGSGVVQPMGSSSESRIIRPANPNAPVNTPNKVYFLLDPGAVFRAGHAAAIIPGTTGCYYYSYDGKLTVQYYNDINDALDAAKAAGYTKALWWDCTPQQATAARMAANGFNGTEYDAGTNNCWHMVAAALEAARGDRVNTLPTTPNNAWNGNEDWADGQLEPLVP